MNIRNKMKTLEKNPEFLALAGIFALFMLLLLFKLGVLVGQLIFQLFGR